MEEILTELAYQHSFRIEESTSIGVARRYAARLAEAMGFSETRSGELAIVVTEAATNILRHAGRGELLVRPVQGPRGNGIELLALDSGPGIVDLGQSMRDGISTAGTAGSGLGAMQRLAAEFSVYTRPDKGVVVYLVLWAAGQAGAEEQVPKPSLLVGVVSLSKPGEDICGDGWAVVDTERSLLGVADGLGHGPDAAAAARASLSVLRDHADLMPARLLERAHQRARATRGAAVAFAVLPTAPPGPLQLPGAGSSRTLQFAGVGNISACVVRADLARKPLISHNGIVGHNLRKVQEVGGELQSGDLLIMHSDGLSSQWDLASYPGLVTRHPALIAAVLYRDFGRGSDDMTVLVARCAA